MKKLSGASTQSISTRSFDLDDDSVGRVDPFSSSSRRLYGDHERQKTTLSREFQRATSQMRIVENPRLQELKSISSKLVVIKGSSGLGKTSLTKVVEEQIISSTKGIFGYGKFNLESNDDPYSALLDALNQIYGQAVSSVDSTNNKDHDVRQLKKDLSSALGEDVTLLATLIPGLESMAPADLLVKRRTGLMQELYNPDVERAQWKNSFKVFIRVLCQHCSPVVLVMAELQWADRSSLDVMEDLLSDTFNEESLMILGTFCSDEVHDDHPLSTTMRALENKKKKFKFEMTHMEPQNLTLDDVHKITMSLLGMDDLDATRGLAEICFKRTLGNPNFVVQFMTMLKEEGMITFNLGLLKWVWDDNVIETETMSTENVVDLLQFRMKKLPFDMRLLLQYAACLGSSFDPSILAVLWGKHGSSKMSNETEILEKLKENNFLESHGENYQWVHDKVQEAALEMEEAQRPSFYFEVGSTLMNELPDDKLDDLLFVVTNLINKSNVHGRLEFAELNLRAAEKAQRLCAFYNGASYAAKAIELLPTNDKWTKHREMTLQAYTMGAEMEAATANADIAQQYCDVILNRDDYTAIEKYRLYMVKLNILMFVLVRFKDAIDFSLDILKEFGFKLAPKHVIFPVYTIRSLKKTIKLAKKTTITECRSLKPSDDTRLEAIMTVLGRLNYACVHGGNPLLSALTAVKMVTITLEHGLFSFSGAAQCVLGMVCMMAMGDVPSATYFAETGVLMQKSIPSKHFVATTMLISYHVILPWSQPLGSCRPQLQIGYEEGIRTGNLSEGL